jgi:dephospho-CoA kinase
MLQVGITGGIGSGKSLVVKIFQCLGVAAYDADSRAKYVMTTDGILISNIKKEFGDLSYDNEDNLNRSYLSSVVFHDPAKLQKLNAIVHPHVAEDYKAWVARNRNQPYLLKEAALLFESGTYKSLDKIIVVSAPTELRVKRVLQRDQHRTEQQVKDIIERQLPEDEKLKRADFVIKNDESQLVIPQVLNLHQLFSTSRI